MKERNDIDQLFRENFEDFSMTPPASLKTNIDKQIVKSDSKKIWIWLSALVLLFSIGGIAYYVSSSKVDSSKPTVTANANNNQSSNKINPTTNEISPNSTNQSIDKNPRSSKSNEHAPEQNPTIKSAHTTVSIKHGYAKSPVSIQTEKSKTTQKLLAEQVETKTVRKSKSVDSTNAKKSNMVPKSTEKNKPSTSTMTSSNAIKTESNPVNLKEPLNLETGTSTNTKTAAGSISGAKTTPKDSLVSNKSENKDSLNTEIAKQDSTQGLISSNTNPPLDKESGNKASNKWLILFQGGLSFAPKYNYESGSNERINTSTKPGYGIDLAFSRNINWGKMKYVGINMGYGSYTNTNDYNFVNQTTYTITDSIPIYDTANVIIGYNYFTVDSTVSNPASANFSTTNTLFAFGLQTQFDFNLSENIGISITPAFRYALNSFKNSDNAFAAYKTHRLQFQLGLDLYYDWKKWRFMLGMNSRYLMNIKAPSFSYQERNRIQLIPQLGIGFKF